MNTDKQEQQNLECAWPDEDQKVPDAVVQHVEVLTNTVVETAKNCKQPVKVSVEAWPEDAASIYTIPGLLYRLDRLTHAVKRIGEENS
jgi:hypothetical protein